MAWRRSKSAVIASLVVVAGLPMSLWTAAAMAQDAPAPAPAAPQPEPVPPPQAQPPQPEAAPGTGEVPIHFNFKDSPFDQVIDFFSRETGLPLIKEVDVPGAAMTFISDEAYTLPEALSVLNLNMARFGVHLRREGKYLYLSSLQDASRKPNRVEGSEIPDEAMPDEILTITIPLNNARAELVATQIKPLIGPYGGITPIPAQNMVVVVESAAQCRRIREIVRSIDDVRPVDSAFKLFTLKHAKADAVVAALRGLVGERQKTVIVDKDGQQRVVEEVNVAGLNIQPDARTNSVIAVGSEARIKTVEELVGLLDVPPGGEAGEQQLMSFALQGMTVEIAQQALNAMYAQAPADRKPVVVVSPEQQRVTVVGAPTYLRQAAALIGALDPEGAGAADGGPAERVARTIRLKHVTSAQLEPMLGRLLTARQQQVLRFVGSADRAGIVVSGPASDVEVFAALVAGLDVTSDADRDVRIVKIGSGDPAAVVARAGELYAQAGLSDSRPVTVSVDAPSRTVTLVGSREGLTKYEEILRTAQESVTVEQQTRTLDVAGRPSEIAPLLSRVLRPMLEPADGSVYVAPVLEPVDELKSIVVRARAEQFTVIEAMLKRLDESRREAGGELRTYRVERADPDAMAASIKRLAETGMVYGSAGAPAGSRGVTVDVERSTRTLIVTAPAAAYPQVEKLLAELDVARVSPAALKMYTLSHARAERLAPLLERLLLVRIREAQTGGDLPVGVDARSMLEVVADAPSNTLIISAPEPVHIVATELLKSLDGESAAGSGSVVRIVPLAFAEVNATAAALSQAAASMNLPSGGRVSVTPAPGANSIILSGLEMDIKKVEELITPLDVRPTSAETPAVETFALKHADAAQIATTVERLLVDQQETDPRILTLQLRYAQNRPDLFKKPTIRVQAESRTNALIVSAPQGTLELARAVIEKLDQPASDPERTAATYTPARGDAGSLAQSVVRVINATLPQGRTPLELSVEPRTGSILALGTRVQVDEAMKLLKERDERSMSMPASDVRIVELAHSDAESVASMVQPMLMDRSRWPEELLRAERAGLSVSMPNVRADARLNRLVVSGPSALMSLATELVAVFDKPAQSRSVDVRVFRLDEGTAQSVADAVRAALAGSLQPGEKAPTVSGEPSGNTVLVSGTAEQIERASSLIESMDTAGRGDGVGVRTVFLKHARAEQVSPLIEQVLKKQSVLQMLPEWQRGQVIAQTGGKVEPEVRVAAEKRLNAVVVSGPLATLALAEQMIEELDVAGDGSTSSSVVRVITLQGADAAELASNIEQVLADGDDAGPAPTIRVDRQSNSLIVRATQAQYATIEGLVKQLDRAALASSSQVRMIPVDRSRADAELMAQTLKRLLEDRGGVSVEVISSEELLKRSESGEARPVGKPTSDAGSDPALRTGMSPVFRALAIAAIAQPAAGALSGDPESDVEGGVTIGVDPATNSLIVVGPPRLTDRIATLAAQLERSLPAEPGKVRIVTLPETIDASSVAGLVNQTVASIGRTRPDNPSGFTAAVSVSPDPSGGALIVWANDTDFAVVGELIASMAHPRGGVTMTLRVIPLESMTAQQVVQAIADLVSAQPRGFQARRLRSMEWAIPGAPGAADDVLATIEPGSIRVVPSPGGTSLIVAAPAEAMPLIERFVSVLDQSPTGDRLAIQRQTLEHARPTEVASTLQKLFDARRQGPAAQTQAKAQFVGDDGSGTLFATGSPSELKEAIELAESMDQPATSRDFAFRMIELKHARAMDIGPTLQNLAGEMQWERMIGGRGSEGPQDRFYLEPNERTNSIVLLGRKETLDTVEQIIATMDRPPTEGAALVVKAVPITSADLNAIEGVIERAMATPGWRSWRGPDPDGVTVEIDRARRAVILVGKKDRVETAAKYVADLDVGGPGATIETIRLEHASAERAAQSLQRFFASRSQSQGLRPDSISVLGSQEGNVLIASGDEESMKLLRDLVAQMDQPELGENRAIEAYAVINATPQEAAQTIRSMFPRTGKSEDQVIVTPQPSTGTLIVSAPQESHAQIAALVKQIDSPPTDGGATLTTVKLESAKASEVAEALRAALPPTVKVTITPVARSNSLLLSGTPEAIEIVLGHVRKIDEQPTASAAGFKRIKLEHALVDRVYLSMTELLRNRPKSPGDAPINLDYSSTDNTLSITAPAQQLAEIEAMVKELDVPSSTARTTEFVKLDFADAEQTSKALGVFYGRTAPEASTPGARNVTIVADPASNSLVVSAEAAQWEGIRSLLGKLDTEDYDRSRQMEVIPLRYADATGVARAISEGFRSVIQEQIDARIRNLATNRGPQRAGETFPPALLVDQDPAPSVSAEVQTNSLVVFASKRDLDRISAIVARLDEPESSRMPEARIIPLRGGSATTVANSIREVFAASTGQGRSSNPRALVIVGDEASNALIVRCEETQFSQVKALAEALQGQADITRLATRVLRLDHVPAARLRQTLLTTFQPVAQQNKESLAIEIDRSSNALVVASSQRLFEQIQQTVKELDVSAFGAAEGEDIAPGLGQVVTIVDVENTSPADLKRQLDQLGISGAQPPDRPGIVSEPVVTVALSTRRSIAVVAGPTDGRIVAGLIKQLDSQPIEPTQTVDIVRLKLAAAAPLVNTLRTMMNPAEQQAQTGPARALAEQVRRLSVLREGVGQPTLELDLSRPIRLVPDPETNSVLVASTPANVEAIRAVIDTLDTLATGDAVVIRMFALENASAIRVRTVVDTLFRQGEALRRLPGTQRQGLPTTATGQALAGEIALAVDDRTNTLVVAGREEAVALVEILIKDLDSTEATSWIEPAIIQLTHADATSMADMLRRALVQGLAGTPEALGIQRQIARLRVVEQSGPITPDGAPNGAPDVANVGTNPVVQADLFAPMTGLVIQPAEPMNALVVIGSASNIRVVRELVRMLDIEAAAASNTVRVFPLEHAGATRVAGLVSEIFRQREGTGAMRPEDKLVVTADTRTNTLIASASVKSFSILDALLKTLDSAETNESVGLHVVPVPSGDVAAMAPRIQRLMRERMEASRRAGSIEQPEDAFSIEPDPANSLLIVACSDENLKVVEDLVGSLTTDAAAIAGAERTALIPLTQGRASDVADTVNTLYVQKEIARRGQRAVSVIPNVQLNALVVSGTESDVNAVRGIVERLETAEVTAVQEVKRIELRTANALEVVNLLENVLAGRSLGGSRGIGSSQATRLRYLRDQIATEIAGETGDKPTEAAIDGAIREQVRMTPDLRTNSLMVAAPPEIMEVINAIVSDLDATNAGSRKVEWFRLKNADARAMAQVLQDLFSLRQDGDRLVLVPTQREPDAGADPAVPEFASTTLTPIPDSRKELSITIDARTNTLLVSGTAEYLDLVRSVVEELDGIEATERMQLVYKLRYAKADDVEQTLARYFQEESSKVRSTLGPEQAGSLTRQLEQEVTVVGDGKSNKLVVSTSPRYAEIVKSIIEELDAAPPQVMIQVLLAEVTLDSSQQWAMEFSAGPFGGNMWKFGSLGAGAGVATALGVANLSISTNDFNVLIRALEVQGKLEVLSRPQVAVNNNEKALIQVGEDIAIVTGVERLDNGNTRSDVERRDVGIILNVTPSISADGFVRLEISPEISSVSTRTTQISEDFEAPIITTRKVDTVVTVKDGQTIVIGGLIQNTLEDRRTKVPLLGDIPLLGNAFKSKQVENIKTELLVILTPKVVPGDSPSAVELQNRWTQHEIGRMSSPEIIRDALEMHDGTPPARTLSPEGESWEGGTDDTRAPSDWQPMKRVERPEEDPK
jgi:type II secretion system protein D